MVNDDVPKDASADEPDATLLPSELGSSPGHRGDVTQILSAIEQGDQKASKDLLPLVYEELRKLAADKMAQEKPGQTLQSTALVHEAYVRLVDAEMTRHWDSRGHFFSAAAEVMRRILVENARRKAGPAAGGELLRVDISEVDSEVQGPDLDLIALNEALARLEINDQRSAELVKLRFFAGLTNEQAAKLLGITPRTAYADWAYAKSLLRQEMVEMP